MNQCAFCGAEVEILDRVLRKQTCPQCGEDLHCCLQCRFYEEGRQNDCREPRAERVLDKDRANYCDYFEFHGVYEAIDSVDDAKKKLNDLFK